MCGRTSKLLQPLILLFAVVAFAASCSTSPVPPPQRSPLPQVHSPTALLPSPTEAPVPPGRTLTVGADECPDATGYEQATLGPLSVGDFTPERIGPPQDGQDGYKTFVISQRPGHDDAVIEIRDPDGQTTTERRPTGVSTAYGVEQFFPGTLRLHSNGTYRITASVGPDTICVQVRYQVSCPTTAPANEIQGTTTPDATLWALLFTSYPLRAGADTKMVLRMTGAGDITVAARAPDGHTIHPRWGPEPYTGSSWNRPGAEWGTGFRFTTPGCWALIATRGATTGSINLIVR